MYLSPVPVPYGSKSFGLLSIFLTIQCGAICGMTPVTILGGSAIDTNNPAINFRLLRVTLRASHLAVRSVQRIIGLAVIERRSAPLANGVASGTILLAARRHELPAMNILVAFEALLRSM